MGPMDYLGVDRAPDQVARMKAFTRAHPQVTVLLPGKADVFRPTAVWQQTDGDPRLDGTARIVEYDELRDLLDYLEALFRPVPRDLPGELSCRLTSGQNCGIISGVSSERENEMSTYYRIQDSSRDAQALLDPANWVSRVWYDATVTCPSCRGIQPESWLDECEDCSGHGVRNLSDMPRRGVSACESIEDLAKYFDRHAGQLDADSVVIELEGEMADDDDFDADENLAVLILPSAVISVAPAAEFAELEELMA